MELQPPASSLLLFSESRLPMLVKSPLLLLARVILHIYYYLLANEDSEATGAAGSPERQARFEIRDQATGLFQSFRVYISGSGLCCALAALLLPRWLAAGCLGLAPPPSGSGSSNRFVLLGGCPCACRRRLGLAPPPAVRREGEGPRGREKQKIRSLLSLFYTFSVQ